MIFPALGSNKPIIISRNVVFPAPLLPIMPIFLFSIPQIFECYIPYCGIPDFNKVNEFLFKNGIHINMNTFKKNVGQSELSFIE
jgi:hypothetical protein